MRLQRLLIVTVLAFSFGTMAEAGKPASGSKKPFFDETPAEFSFPLFEDFTGNVPVLTGDSPAVSIYSDAPGGIAAYFMGSGNPELELGDPTRHVYLRLDPNEVGCDLPQLFIGRLPSKDGISKQLRRRFQNGKTFQVRES